MISVIGGKLTTAAALARDCARKIGIQTAEPQFEAVVQPGDVEGALSGALGRFNGHGTLTKEMARATVNWFGLAGLDVVYSAVKDERLSVPICDGSLHMVAEAVHALRHECAVTLGDVLLRRAPVALAGGWPKEHTRQAAERIGKAMAWSEARVGREVEDFEREREQFLMKVLSGVSMCSV